MTAPRTTFVDGVNPFIKQPAKPADAAAPTSPNGKPGRPTAISSDDLQQIRALRDKGKRWIDIEKLYPYDTRTMRKAVVGIGAYATPQN